MVAELRTLKLNAVMVKLDKKGMCPLPFLGQELFHLGSVGWCIMVRFKKKKEGRKERRKGRKGKCGGNKASAIY